MIFFAAEIMGSGLATFFGWFSAVGEFAADTAN